MARGYFRTDKKTCVCCGSSGNGVKTYRRGPKNSPTYDCESCFDKYASDEEMAIKEDLITTVDGVEIIKRRNRKGV